MESTTSPLFDRFLSPDPASLTGALFFHARSVEDVLIAAGHVPRVGYTALDVLRIAATLMTASDGADGFLRWLLPEPEREECHGSPQEEDGLPF